jgi:3,4-dihydroxy 2-butanone 4-phosphate synthase/GTP cyclohydrolase II
MTSIQKSTSSQKLNTIEDAIKDIKAGKVVVVVDDENRENEGDFIAAAAAVTPEMINFMATHGRGLICAPLTETRCDELDLNMMVQNNTVLHHTQFTVSVDLIGHGCTTGISVSDRAKTIKSLVDPKYETTRPWTSRTYISFKSQKRGCFKKNRTYRSCCRFGALGWL